MLVNYCKKKNIKYFRGSLNNVYDRTIKCCKKYKFNSFLRICGDRPFFDYKLAKKMETYFRSNNFDIVTNVFPKTYPKGLACEIIKLSAFKKVKKNKFKKGDKEHILNYFYRNHKNYKIKNFHSKYNRLVRNMNLAIDNEKDYIRTKQILSQKKFDPLIPTTKAIKIARSIN